MARVTAPLMSLGASGTLADAIVYSQWKGLPYVRTRVIPYNPKSDNQKEVRGVFGTICEMFKRMPQLARDPWQAAALGQAWTDRNKFIGLNVPALKGDANLNDLVMSVASGGAVPPSDMVATGGVLKIAVAGTAPTAPPGYTLKAIVGVACLDGDPSPAISLDTYAAQATSAPWSFDIIVPAAGDYQCGIFAKWQRDADLALFYSSAIRSQEVVTAT